MFGILDTPISGIGTRLPLWLKRPSPALRYSGAVLLAALAQGVRLPLQPATLMPCIKYVPFILLTTAFGGLGPGLLSTALCALESAYFATEPLATLRADHSRNWLGIGALALTGLVASVLLERLKRSGERQRAAYLELATVQRSAPVMLLVVDDALRVRKANDLAVQFAGQNLSDILGLGPGGAIRCPNALADPGGCGPGPACAECAIRQAVSDTLRNGTSHSGVEVWVPLSVDGREQTRCLQVSTVPMQLDENSKTALVCAQDITERKQAEVELRQHQDALRQQAALTDLSHDAIITADQNRVITGWNTGAREMYGWTQAEAVGNVTDHFLQTSATISTGTIDEILGRAGRWDGELEHSQRDETRLTVDSRQVLLRDPEGNPAGILQINRDITEHKRAEAELRQQRNALRRQAALIDLSHDAIIIADKNRVITGWNTGATELYGWAEAEAQGNVIHHLLQTSAMISTGTIDEILNRAGRWDGELEHPRRDGTRLTVDSRQVLMRDSEGNPSGILEINRDITERKAAREQLQEAHRRTTSILESMSDGFNTFDREWRYTYVNAAATRILRKSREELLGNNIWELWPYAADSPFGEAIRRAVAENVPTQVEAFYPEPLNGWFEVRCYPSPEGLAQFFTDVTKRKQADEEIHRLNAELEQRVRARTAQLEAANQELETFAYSVSHDLRAPLRAMNGWSLTLVEDFGAQLNDEARRHLGRVRSEAQRMGQLIDDLLQLSRVTGAPLDRGYVDLTAVARSIADNLRDMHAGRQIEFVIQPGLTASGDARLLEVALTNLLNNAAKFTGKQAEARIEVGRTEHEGQPAFYVRDNGAGFDMAYARSLFGPFQRLHSAAEFPGSGIGLATVQRIIHRHGGRVWAEAQVDQGATFYFRLG